MKTYLLNAFSKIRYLAMLMSLTLLSTNVWGADEVYKSTTFSSTNNSTGVSSYTNSWYNTTSGFRVNITNANNNNNGWSYIKMGSKNSAVTGTIITNAVIDKKITKVSLNVGAITATNITSIKLYTSTNGSTWTERGTFDKSTGKKEVAIATANQATNLYYKIEAVCIKASNGALQINDIEFYAEAAASCTTNPTVTAGSNSSVTSTTATVSCSSGISSLGSAGCSISSYGFVIGTSANPSVGGSGVTKHEVGTTYTTTGTSFSKNLTGLSASTTYYVRPYATNGKGTAYGTQTSFTTLAPPKYTVTLKDDDTELVQASAGASVTLPTRTGCTGYTFAGWTKSWATAKTTWTTTAPTIIPAGSYTPTANENLYPVYTKTEGGGTTYQFQKVTSLSQINAGGTFIITNGIYYLPNAQATNAGPSVANMVAITNGIVTGTVTDAMKWTFSKADANSRVTITSCANANNYLKTNNDNNGLRVTTGSDSWTFEEYTVSSVLGFAMKSTSQSRYCAVYQTSNWRTYTTKNHSNYQQNSGRLDLYKETAVSSSTTSYISVPNCCTPLGAINGSISWSDGTQATLTWANNSNVNNYSVTCKAGASNAGSIGTITGTATKSCEITGLTAGTDYTFTINATAKSGYCDASQEITSKAPKITLGATSGASVYAEESGPGSKQTFTVTGVGLTDNLTVTALENFEVCATQNGTYASSITLTQSSGAVNATVYFRLVSGKTVGSYGPSDITVSGGGAASQTVSVTGTVSPSCAAPTINTHPVTASYTINATATALSVSATKNGTGPDLTYQWYSNTANNNTSGTKISGATNSTYTPPTAAAGSKYYYCVVSSGACLTASNVATVTVTVPTLTVSPTSLTGFTYNGTGPSTAQTFTVSGSNLADDVTVTAPTNYEVCKTSGGTYSDDVTYSPTAGALSNQTVYVRLKSGLSAKSSYIGNVTVASTNADSKTVALSGSVPYTITWSANGETHETTYVTVGGTLVLPGAPSPSTYCSGKTFMGWTANPIAGTQNSAPTYVSASTKPSANTTYYAVFATSSVGRIEVNTTNSGVTGSYSDLEFTISGIKFYTTNWLKSTNIQAKASTTYSIYNNTAFPENISSIKVVQTGTARAITIHGSNYYDEDAATEAGDTYVEEQITSPSTSATMIFNFSGKAFKYFYLSTPGNAVYMDSIVINYGSASAYRTTCSDCTPIAAPTVTATPGDCKITLTWPSQTGADSYTVTKTPAGGSIGTPTLTDGTYTCVISGLTNGTAYTYNVVANGSSPYCSSEDNTAATGTATPNIYYSVSWNSNGETYSAGVNAGNTTVSGGTKIASMPTAPADNTLSCGNKFMGWSTSNLGAALGQSAPADLFTDVAGSPTITSNTTFYAVFATVDAGGGAITDGLTRETTGITSGSTTYADWSGKTGTSGAVYAGNSAGSYNSIQIRTDNSNSGIVSTTSGGKLSKVTVVWNDNTSDGRKIDIYGKTTAYSAPSDLYGGSAGTKLGSIVYGTSTELDITGNYTYIGIRSNNKPLYLDNIYISYGSTSYTNYVTNCCSTPTVQGLTYTATTTAVTLNWTLPADVSGISKFQVKDDADNVIKDNISKSATTSGQITGLTECNEYKYKVVSVGASCNSATALITCIPSSGNVVTFNYGGNGQANTTDKTGCGKTEVTLPTPAAWSHHTFNGWYSAATGGTKRGDAGDSWTPSGSSVTLYAQWTEDSKYTVTWTVNGAAADIADGEGKTWVYTGNNITALPTAPDGSTACDDGKVFVGWTSDAAISEETDTRPTVLFSSIVAAPAITGNVTYRAVFATSNGGSGDYKLVKSDLGEDWAGQYLIAYSSTIFANGETGGTDGLGKANNSVNPGSHLVGETVAGDWADENAVAITLEEISSGSNTYLMKTQDGVYNYQTSNSNGLASTATRATAASYPISITFTSANDIKLKLGGAATGAVFRYNTSGYFRFYKDGGQSAVYLYKKQTGGYKAYITDCSKAYTVSFSINGELSATTLTEASEGAGVLRSAFPSVTPATNPTGWNFLHWSESVNGTAAISTSGSPAKYFPSHNITLYAVWSKTVDAETTYRSNVCVSPLTGLTLNAAGNVKAKRADLSWAAVANADKYLLEYKIDGSDSWSSKELVTTSTTLTGLTDNKTYQWRVTALPTAGSQYCEIVANGTSFTTEPYIPGTISLIPGSGTCAVSTLTGDEVVLPSASASCEELAFVGWTTKTGWNNQTTGTKLPDPLYKAGDKVLTEDIDEIYAVYRVGEGGDGQYEHILTAAGLAEGAKVVIVGSSDTYNTNAMKQYVSGSYMPSAEVTISASKITSASVESSGAAVWTIGKIVDGGNTYYTFKDQSNRYLTSNTSTTSNYLAAAAAETPDMYARWTIEVTNASEGNMLIKCAGKNDYDYIRFNSGSPRFNCYKSSSGVVPATLWIYKKAEASTYLHSQTTCVECQSVASLAKNSVTAVMSVPNEAVANPNPLINPNSGAQTWSSSNPDIATVNASTGALTLKAEGDVIITVKQAKSITSGEARCKVDLSYNLHIKSPSLEVIDWERNTVVVESDIQLNLNVPPSDPNYTTISAGELNEVRSNVATELFFSKYFEASANVKMLGIYNGTLEPIDLSKYRIRSYSDDNTKAHIILFSEYDHVPSILEESQEAIFYSHQWNSNDQEILECAEEETDMSGWYCIPAKTEDNPTGKYTWYATSKSVTFGGKEVITLQKNTGTAESPVWTTIDIIGSTYADGTKDNRQLRTPSWGDADGWVANDGKEYGTGNTIGLSTNRCLLIRNLDVKNGANAVAKNITDADNGFATLAEEWTGKHVANTDANYSSCKNFAYVGGFDYATFYDQYSLLEGSSIQVRDNGTYGVVLDGNINGDYLYNNRCGRINLKIIQGGQEKISKSYKIPIIVRGEADTSDPIFRDAGGSGKGKLTCLTCDVVVRADDNVNYDGLDINSDDAGKLTISKTGVVNMRNLEIYEGGEVIVPNTVTLSVNSLRLRAFNDNSAMLPKITINGTINNTTNTVYMDRRLDDSKYNWITFPYDVNMSDVTFSNGEPATLGTDYYLKYYDGAKRSADVNANPSNYSQSTYWTMVSGDVLKAGQGYILGIPDESNHNHRLEVRFPMTVADINAAESADKNVPVSATEVTIEGRKNDQGWNLIGDPFLLKYRSSQSGLLSGYWEKSMQGSNWDGGWLLNTSNSVPYVTTLNGNDYAQNVLSSTTLQPFTSFFIQAEPGTTAVTFNSSTGRQPWAAPQRAQEDAPERIYAGLLLVNDETLYRDNTALVIGDKFTSSEYVTGADLQKMKGSNQVLVYSLGKNTELAFQAETPERAVSATPLGFRAMKAGDHTFMLDLDFDVRPFEGIYLYDSQERIETNLLYSDYTFSANREENKSRFSIRVEMREKMPTDTDAKIFDDLWTSVQGRDISIGGMPEDAQIYIYDMTGKLIVYGQVNAPVMRYTMPQNGVYNIRIMSAEGKETIKAIVK